MRSTRSNPSKEDLMELKDLPRRNKKNRGKERIEKMYEQKSAQISFSKEEKIHPNEQTGQNQVPSQKLLQPQPQPLPHTQTHHLMKTQRANKKRAIEDGGRGGEGRRGRGERGRGRSGRDRRWMNDEGSVQNEQLVRESSQLGWKTDDEEGVREKRGQKQLKLTAKPIPMLSLTQIASIGYNIHKLASHDLAFISMKYCPLDKETEVAMGRSYYQLDLLKMHNCTLVEAREEVRGMLEKEGRVYEQLEEGEDDNFMIMNDTE